MLCFLRHLRLLALVLLCIGASQAVAQTQKPVTALVQRLRDAGASFEPVQPLKPAGVLNNEAARFAPQAQFLSLDKSVVESVYALRPQTLALTVPFHNESITIDLVQQDVLTDDFRVETSTSGAQAAAYAPAVHYRGIVRGTDNSVAAFSFFAGELVGMFSEDQHGNMVVGRLETPGNTSDYIVYSDVQLTEKNPFSCSTPDVDIDLSKVEDRSESSVGGCVRVFFEIDNALFQNKGSVQATVDYVSAAFNQLATLYANEQITTTLSQVFVWVTADGYSTSSSSTALNQFKALRTNFNADLAHLVGIAGNNLGGVAYVNTLCNTAYSYAYSDINPTFSNVPTFSWTIEVLTHEMGHNLGSNHTQWCGWTGGAIDNCVSPEGGCAPGPAPTNGGTVMSYCHLSSYGINFNNGFGSQPGNVIRSRVTAASCLAATCPTSGSCPAPTGLTVSNTTGTNATITWTGTGSATSYTLQWRTAGSGTWTTIASASSPYTLTGLPASTKIEVTVRSNCGTASSLYASGAIFTTGASTGTGPSCGTPGGLTASASSATAATVAWSAVSGASSYQVSWKTTSSTTWGSAVTTSATSYNLAGLTASTSYDVRVLAVCSSGNSGYAQSTFSTPASASCNAPTGLTATAASSTSATATWNAAIGATAYQISWKPTSSTTWGTAITTTSTAYSITGLTASTTYDVRVLTQCSAGNSGYALASFSTPGAATCNAPTGLTATASSSTAATVSWGAVTGAITYQISWKTTSSTTWSTALSVTSTSYALTGLATGTAYDVRVLTQCSAGTSAHAQTSFTTPGSGTSCGTPTGLTAAATASTTATATWTPVIGATSYQVSRKLTTSTTWTTAATTTSTTYNFTGLTAGASYNVRVLAVCTSGSSAYAQTTFTMPAGTTCTAPTGLSATPTSGTSATATWTAATGVTQYRISWKKATVSTWSSAITVTGTTYNLNNLSANTTYNVRVQSVCSATTSSAYTTTNFTTPASSSGSCVPPTGLTAINIFYNKATVLWNPVSGVASYQLQVKASTSTSWFTFSNLTYTSVQVTGLQASRSYDVRVRAQCTNGTYTDYTAIYTFTTPANFQSPEYPAQALTDVPVVHLDDEAAPVAFSMMPNPTAGNVAIALDRTSPELVVEVVDLYGHIVRTERPGETLRVEFDLTDLPAGLYLVRASMTGAKPTVQKLVKQ